MPDDRHGPFTTRQWLLGAGGGVAAYFLYRWYQGRKAASAALAGPAAGGVIPGSSVTSSGKPPPSTLAQWQQDALAFGADPISTLNAITNWLAGNCVDQGGYGGLTAAIQQLGLPPGFTNYPVLTVCPSAGTSGGSSAGSGANGSGSSGGGTSGGTASAGGGSSAPAPNVPNLQALLNGVAYAPAAYPGAPQIGAFQVPNFPQGAVNPYGVATPGPGGIVEVVGNTAIGSEPYWQAANNAAIAAGRPIPFPHGAVS